jgi:hypothetical protein
MHQHGPYNLFADIEGPDLERSLRPFLPSFIYECEKSEEA